MKKKNLPIILSAVAIVVIVGIVVAVLIINNKKGGGSSGSGSNSGAGSSNVSNKNNGGVHGSDKKGDGLDNVNESNYASVMKNNFGFEPIFGDGWEIKKVSSPNKVNNLHIEYKTLKDIDADEWRKKYFDASFAVSTDGVQAQVLDWDTGVLSKGKSYTDYQTMKNDGYSSWFYTWNSRSVMLTPIISSGEALIMFVFTEQ